MIPRLRITLVLLVAIAALGVFWLTTREARRALPPEQYLTGSRLADFTSLEPIDAHTHVYASGPDFLGTLARLHMHVLDILYIDDTYPYRSPTGAERHDALAFVSGNPARAQLDTTFDPFRLTAPDFAEAAIAGLHHDYAQGAVGVKIWKNVGMEITDASGQYIMPDDARLDPIYRDAIAQHKTLTLHTAEPDEAWGSGKLSSYYLPYYSAHPEWDMSKHPGAPSKDRILAARDHLLAQYPDLRVVGAHLGSQDMRLDELSEILDRYPNFAVDTAARIMSLVDQPRDQVRAFVLRYQDRIIYGTDLHFYPDSADNIVAMSWLKLYALDWRYFSTDDRFYYLGTRVEGLKLPRSVLQKLYHDNAVRWYPGIDIHWHDDQSEKDTQRVDQ